MEFQQKDMFLEIADAIKTLAQQQETMIKYMYGLTQTIESGMAQAHLENCNGSEMCLLQETGGVDMSKFKERVLVGRTSDNKPEYKYVRADSKEELHIAIAEALSGAAEASVRPSTPEWETYSREWFETFQKPKLRPKTIVKESGILDKHVARMFAGMCVGDISAKHIQDALNKKSNYSKAYVRDIMNMMSKIFSSAIDDGYISRSPMESSKVTNTGSKKANPRRALSAEEQADIISNLHRLGNENDRRFMAFLMFTCMRPGEIYGLHWDDIDMENGLIHIRRAVSFASGKSYVGDPKTEGSKRSIPMDPNLVKWLSPILESGIIISRTDKGHEGEYYTEQIAKNAWNRIKRTINIHDMTPYVGRHTFATNMSKAGIPMRTAISIMGHTDERMLIRHYIHTDEDDITNAGSAMSNFINQLGA